MNIRVQAFVSACCVSCLAATVTAATEPAHGAQGGGSRGGAGAAGRGGRGAPIASRPVSGRPGSRGAAPPPPFTSTLAFRPGLASRRITPFAGTLFGAEALALWDPLLFTAPVQAGEAVVARRASPQPSSIQPQDPSLLPSSSASAHGTLRLDVEPRTAQVYVDGFYVGSVAAVNGVGLTLGTGWHRLEFRAAGYETPAVNVTVEANRTTTYQLALRPVP